MMRKVKPKIAESEMDLLRDWANTPRLEMKGWEFKARDQAILKKLINLVAYYEYCYPSKEAPR